MKQKTFESKKKKSAKLTAKAAGKSKWTPELFASTSGADQNEDEVLRDLQGKLGMKDASDLPDSFKKDGLDALIHLPRYSGQSAADNDDDDDNDEPLPTATLKSAKKTSKKSVIADDDDSAKRAVAPAPEKLKKGEPKKKQQQPKEQVERVEQDAKKKTTNKPQEKKKPAKKEEQQAQQPAKKKEKKRTEIDDIFSGLKKTDEKAEAAGKKKKQKKGEDGSNDSADPADVDEDNEEVKSVFNQLKELKQQKKAGGGRFVAKASAVELDDAQFASRSLGGGRKYTEEGYPIYTEDELKLNSKSKNGPLCPFDCDCCF